MTEAAIPSPHEEPRRADMSLSELVWEFLKIGATSIGDTGPLLAFIERDLVEKRGVLTHDDVTESLTYTKLLPGSTVLQIVAYLSYRLGGWPGSALASIAYLLPATVLMIGLAYGYVAAAEAIPQLRSAVNGVTAAVVGILLATAWRFADKNLDVRKPLTIVIAVAAFLVAAFTTVNVALVMLASGLAGIAFMRTRAAS